MKITVFTFVLLCFSGAINAQTKKDSVKNEKIEDVHKISFYFFDKKSSSEDLTASLYLESSNKWLTMEAMYRTGENHAGATLAVGKEIFIRKKISVTPGFGIFIGQVTIPIVMVKSYIEKGPVEIKTLSQLGDNSASITRHYLDVNLKLSSHIRMGWEASSMKLSKGNFIYTEQEGGPVLTFSPKKFSVSFGVLYGQESKSDLYTLKKDAIEIKRGVLGLSYMF